MYNLHAKFVEFLDICKQFSKNLVNEHGNIPRRGVVPRFSDLEVIALSMTAEALGLDSENYLFHLLQTTESAFSNLISRRQYNDRRKMTYPLCEEIRKRIAQEIDGGENYFCIDSKPLEVCRFSRAKRCKMGHTTPEQAPNFGYCASQKTTYYGYKLHAICGLNGVIHSYDLTAANVGEIHYLQDVKEQFSHCTIIGDKGYISAKWQQDLFTSVGIQLEVPRRKDMNNRTPTFYAFAKKRKRIETCFSQLTDQFMISRNYAKQTTGFFTRITAKISAFTILQFINHRKHKPIGWIKYAIN